MNLRGAGFLAFAGITLASLVLIACSDRPSGGGENWELLNGLTVFEGATLVLEYELNQRGRNTLVQEYAIAMAPAEGAMAVSTHYTSQLVAIGFQEGEARAAFSSFTRHGDHVILGRVGPEMQEPPSDARVTYRTDVPAGTGFFFTLEATAGN